MRSFIVTEGSGTFSQPFDRYQVTVNCATLMLVFVTRRMAFQILPRIYLPCGGVAGNVSVQKLIKMFWPSSVVVFELRRIFSYQKQASAWLVLRYRSWMVYHHGRILAKQVAYFKALGRDTSIFSQRERKRTCGNKRRKMPCYNSHRRWNLGINVRD